MLRNALIRPLTIPMGREILEQIQGRFGLTQARNTVKRKKRPPSNPATAVEQFSFGPAGKAGVLTKNQSCSWAVLLFIFLGFNGLNAQYWGEQILEKSFEKADFFFHSVALNPYGIGNFGNVAQGLIDDPLLNLQINPAYLTSDSLKNHFIYLDFRNNKEITQDNVYSQGWAIGADAMSYRSSIMPYPGYYINSQKEELEPVFSGGYLIRPFGPKSDWTVGLTYQVISQDEGYYAIPQDIYRSNVGLDYNGAAVAEGFGGPITDRYSGNDEMHQQGHFISAVTAKRISRHIDGGLRISRAVFKRNGAYGSQSDWNTYGYQNETNTNAFLTERNQDYFHWDLAAGLNFRLKPQTILGLTAGLLTGNADQDKHREADSEYHWESPDDKDHFQTYFQQGEDTQTWKHEGVSLYGGLNFRTRLQKTSVLNIHYKLLSEDVDISLASTIMDTSFSQYRSTGWDWGYRSKSNYAVHDTRTGSGNREAMRHTFSLALGMQVESRTQVSLGFHVEAHDVRTRTTEFVTASRFSYYEWDDQNNDEEIRSETVAEKKNLHWDFTIRSSRIQIPIIVTQQLSNTFELMLGINRSLTEWKITDETLAVFDYRNQEINGQTENKSDFGERYRQPVEDRSDVTTSVLAGLTMKPSEKFNIRLLMVPQYHNTWEGTRLQNFQWWISFNLLN